MKNRVIKLPPPYLRRVWLDQSLVTNLTAYPFFLPLLRGGFEIEFERPITIVVGEMGRGSRPYLKALPRSPARTTPAAAKVTVRSIIQERWRRWAADLANALRASWLPKITSGWFFRAESFFSVARYLDAAALGSGAPPPDFLSHSHGEGFLRFFEERCRRQGIFIFDEPESALSPSRQIAFLKLLRSMGNSGICQVLMATHSPMLMAYPGAQLLQIS